jgi:hypothetical protein
MEKSSLSSQSDKEFDLQSFIEGQGTNKNAGSADERRRDFKSVFHFTDADLAANRAGKLSDSQVKALKKAAGSSSTSWLGIYLFLFVGFGAVPLVLSGWLCWLALSRFFSHQLEGWSAVIVVVPLLPFTVACLWLAKLFGGLLLDDLRVTLFPVTLRLERLMGTIVPGNKTDDKRDAYEIEINGRSFRVTEKVHRSIDFSLSYTVYTAAYGKDDDEKKILAIEESVPAAYGKSPLEYENEQLRRILNFTHSDIGLNRHSRLSTEQTARLNREIGSGAFEGIVLGCIFGIVPFLVVGGFTQNVFLTIIATGGVFYFFFSFSMRGSRRQRRILATGKVALASGTADVWITKEVDQHSSRGGGTHTETIYHLNVEDAEFEVEEEIYYAFKKGKTYNVYYVPDLDDQPIVSAEQVE